MMEARRRGVGVHPSVFWCTQDVPLSVTTRTFRNTDVEGEGGGGGGGVRPGRTPCKNSAEVQDLPAEL